MEMDDDHHQYGSMADLRQLMNGRSAHLIPSPNIPPTAAAAADHHHHPLFSPAPPPLQPTFEMMMMGRPISAVEIMPRGFPQPHHHHHHHHDFRSDNNSAGNSTASITAVAATTNSAPSTLSGGNGGLEVETGGCLGGDGGTGRWPRQETLTLLEIRSRLDSKFKEANQKGPLWDEVSRIMSDEHGYQRSGKKCREKFENLYKYYKKTKEGKAGRQDGKHYRFFRQLEALYGETSNNQAGVSAIPDHQQTQYVSNNNLQFLTSANPTTSTHQLAYNNNNLSHNNSLSFSNSSEFESSSSDENDSSERRRSRRRGWKAKIKEFIGLQMKKIMEKQEAWLEKLVKTLEQNEKERSLKEKEWMKQEADRIEKEHKFWAKERAWIEARDSALMEALKNLTGKEMDYNEAIMACSSSPEKLAGCESLNQDHDQDGSTEIENNNHHHDPQNNWPEPEITSLIQLRTSMDSRFSQGRFSEEVLWEDIAAKMACLGYDRSGFMCKEKWQSMSNEYVKKYSKESMTSKKRKENSRSGYNIDSSTSLYNHGGYNCDNQVNDGTNNNNNSSPPSNANVGSSAHDHACFPAFLMGDQGSENLWENYGLKINKGGQNQ